MKTVSLAEIDELQREIERLRAQRIETDCRYTMGRVADIDGKHCPPGAPCMRCQIERLQAKLARAEKIIKQIPDSWQGFFVAAGLR